MLDLVLLGFATGMRTMTAVAVLCWAAYLGRTPLGGTWAFWMGMLVTAIVFTLAAVGEYVGDTLPRTPSRASTFPAISRMVFGALVGAAGAASIGEPWAGGVLAGVAGALIGTFGMVRVRAVLSRLVGHDLPVALAESVFALCVSLLAVRGLHREIQTVVHHAGSLVHSLRP